MKCVPSYLHPIPDSWLQEPLPSQFTYPFRYVPHPLCRQAALAVEEKLEEMANARCQMTDERIKNEEMDNGELIKEQQMEGKMYGVMVVRDGERLYFLAAYSGQLCGSYSHPWFVPPVVDYLAPESYFQQEQAHISDLTSELEALRHDPSVAAARREVEALRRDQAAAVTAAKAAHAKGHVPAELRPNEPSAAAEYIRQRQHQKADIARARRIHRETIAAIEERLQQHNSLIRTLADERRNRSEALQQWLFGEFSLLNARGERRDLIQIFGDKAFIPSGAGECCAPKLLQAAYDLGLQPLCMAEFWWGSSRPDHYRQPGAFFPACRSKCLPILRHMLIGLDVEPDPAHHYEGGELDSIKIVWEDADLAVIVKPQGWCSIPGRSDQANLVDEAHRLWPDIEGSVVVHRLDQDTSGIMVLAKNASAHRALARQFELREVHKRYVALVEGELDTTSPKSLQQNIAAESPNTDSAQNTDDLYTLSLPIAPDLDDMPRRRVDFTSGKEAITLYRILSTENHGEHKVTRVEFFPQTGRTHQLRVHSAAREGLNHPILGDRLYGTPSDRLYLHAEAIDFTHPTTHQPMHFEAKTPF